MTTTSEPGSRIALFKTAPDVYKTMAAFQAAAADGLDPVVAELIKIRASQINKCAYCIDMHLTEAREQGESALRLDLLSAWQEVDGVYSERERAALALTESITLLTQDYVPDEVYERAAKHFDEAELARLIAQIVAINAWNRFQVTTRAVPAGVAKLKDA
ncbi:carboxymuconolactone decarboxylase family protein [Streptomyces armeniacus]|uniref:Carboxymuconolactone decarboxylase family protein n=1 Tax=Streptomyces armeniacus TaxID=83291 RepID=A0A345Y011_9ACTN|nr:carboxymuconolactone decarboxylase family protein [Streptomyces armeniacus]AXK37227.1 carboxymuconolactone decarboxylase family protein [Streptomyces armeniacus]